MSCQKTSLPDLDPAPPIVETKDTLTVLWQSPLIEDTLNCLSIGPFLSDQGIITSSAPLSVYQNEQIRLFNKENGELKWIWEDYIAPSLGQKVFGTSRIHIKNDLLLANSSQDNYGIDLNTGQSIWNTIIPDGDPISSLFGNLLFHTISYANSPYGDSSALMYCEADKGNWKEVFKIEKSDDYEVRLYPPSVYLNDKNDTILIFQNTQIIISPYDGKVDLYCYNMTQKRVEWVHYDLDDGESNVRPPLIEGDYVYFAGKWTFFCFNKITGELRWKRKLHWDFQGSNFLLHEEKLITTLDNGDLIALDKQTGETIWINEGLSACCVEMKIYNDRIYYGDSRLFIVDVNTGEMLHKYNSPNYSARFPGAKFLNTVAIDEETGIMYTTDGYFLMAMKIPE